jgi:hypothetical protein
MVCASVCVIGGVGTARADDPCRDPIVDPIATPLRVSDEQRGACLRHDVTLGLTTHVLIDTPNFHGLIGGGLVLAGRAVVRERLELGARIYLVDYTFAQTAVTKATATRLGPVAIQLAYALTSAGARVSLIAALELPYTRDQVATVHTAGQLGLAFAGTLSERVTLHARLVGLGAYASSSGGSARRVALRAGTDLAFHVRPRVAVVGGLDAEAGWRTGFSTLMPRAGLQWRPGAGAYRALLAAGVPLGGDEPTTAIVTLGVARDLR